jgi:orotate phosphoribosyltransferase
MGSENASEDTARETLQILKEFNAILENDHFVYVSGDHGSSWINKDAIFPHTKYISRLGLLLAEAIMDLKPEVICAPAIAGIIVAQWTAYHLGVLSVFAEHDPSWKTDLDSDPIAGIKVPFILRRGYDKMVTNRRVIIVDDVVNTGFSILSTMDAVSKAGGDVVAIASLINRGNIDMSKMNHKKFIYLLEYDIPLWPASECELCKDGVPVNTNYGHGHEFLLSKAD